MQIIKSVTALAGAGKTHVMINQINQSNEKYIVLAPTIRLCDQIASGLHDVEVIHSEIEGIKSSSVELQKIISAGVRVICSTHQSFAHMIKSKDIQIENYHLIVDETPAAILEAQVLLDKDSFKFMTDLMTFTESKTFIGFTEVSAKNIDSLKHKLSKDAPSLYKTGDVKHFIECVANNAYLTLIPSEMFSDFRIRVKENTARLDTVSLMRPEVLTGAKSCTVMSAFFDYTEFSMVMKAQGVQFDEQNIPVRYKEHTNGSRLKVKYFSSKLNSKKFANTKNDNGESNIELITRHIQGELTSKGYIYNANIVHRHLFKSEDGNDLMNAKAVTSVHGVNDLQGIHNAVYLPALNPNASSTKALEHIGLTVQDIVFARNQLLAYQFLMRTSLRDPSRTEDVTFYCIDKLTADFIAIIFKCEIELIEIDLAKSVDGRHANGGNKNAGRKKNTPELQRISKELRRLRSHKNPDQNLINALLQQRAMIKAN